MIAFAAERLMEIEVGALTGAGHGELSTKTGFCPGLGLTLLQAEYDTWARR
jgi:hypothetical protein